jgi:CBS domain-containing protein
MTPPPLIVESTIRFLRGHEPFARMARADLEFLAAHVELTYHATGSLVTGPVAVDGALYIVQQGHVRATVGGGAPAVLGPGDSFPLATDPATPPPASYEATEDAFCYRLAAADVAALRTCSAAFAEFWAQSSEALLRQSLGRVRGEFGSQVVEQQALLQPVMTFVRRAPVACDVATSLADALAAMAAAGVGTIAVTDSHDTPVGIFTLTDLMERVVLPGVPLLTPAAQVMTPHPGTIDADASAEDALALMVEKHYHQLLVTRGGRLCGVVSERDLFALQRVSMRHVLAAVRRAADLPALRRAAADTMALADNLLAQGLSAESLTRTVAALRDAITARAILLTLPAHSLDGVSWCWLALGSEGRAEQTILSDQDNAIAFDPGHYPLVEARHRMLGFAAAVNDALAALGFPLCSGGVMARNPDYCLAVGEWQGRLRGWLREPTPEALLGAAIVFDFRALAGDAALASSLREWLAGAAAASPLFLRLLAGGALAVAPPLGIVRTFVTADGPAGNLIDVKTRGTRLFVDAARLLALGAGIVETGTAARLRVAGRRLGLADRETAAFIDAFQYLQLLRLRAQRGALDGARGPARSANAIDPATLNEIDRRMLREALRQARALQTLCARTYAP